MAAVGDGEGEASAVKADAMEHIVDLLSAEDWEAMPEALRGLRAFVEEVPLAQRSRVLHAALELTDRVRTEAVERRRVEAARLKTLRTGQQATASYRATAAPNTV